MPSGADEDTRTSAVSPLHSAARSMFSSVSGFAPTCSWSTMTKSYPA